MPGKTAEEAYSGGKATLKKALNSGG